MILNDSIELVEVWRRKNWWYTMVYEWKKQQKHKISAYDMLYSKFWDESWGCYYPTHYVHIVIWSASVIGICRTYANDNSRFISYSWNCTTNFLSTFSHSSALLWGTSWSITIQSESTIIAWVFFLHPTEDSSQPRSIPCVQRAACLILLVSIIYLSSKFPVWGGKFSTICSRNLHVLFNELAGIQWSFVNGEVWFV